MGEDNKNSHKRFKIFIIIFIIGSLFLLKEENQKKMTGIIKSITSKEKVLELIDSFDNEGDILDINIYDDTIVKWNNNKLSFLNIDGIKVIDKEFNFTEPSIYYGENHIYAMDKSTGDIYSLNKKGETIDKLQLDKEIFNFEEIHQNVIYHGKSSGMEDIDILDKEGIQLGYYSYENENILRYSTNRNGTKNAIAVIEMDEARIKSRIDCYGKNNEKLNEVDIDNEIVVYLEFTSMNEIVALTDSGIHFIKDGEIIWGKRLNLIKDIYLTQEEIYILYSNYLEAIDFKGNTKNKIGFTEEYKRILPFKRNTLLYGDKHIAIVDGKKEILKQEEDIIGIDVSKDNILIWGPEEIKIYKMGIGR